MAIKEIRHFGDPVLITSASEVVTFDKELRKLVKDLTETMLDAPGAGLAAPQIGVPLRVFVWDVDEAIGHLINPTLDLSEEMQDGDEGCLSFPELVYPTPRAFRAVAKGFTMHGEPITVEGTELLARALQHETDHLNGVLFIDRLSEENRKLAMKEIRESDWFGLAGESGVNPTIKVSPHSLFGQETRGSGF
jgi:peptide deformylase